MLKRANISSRLSFPLIVFSGGFHYVVLLSRLSFALVGFPRMSSECHSSIVPVFSALCLLQYFLSSCSLVITVLSAYCGVRDFCVFHHAASIEVHATFTLCKLR